jgi:metal-responsive CopG/Arc/MetJ family transcriptional regulator
MSVKVMTVRIDEEMAAELATVARIDEMPVSDAVRDAIAKHIASRRTDPEFKKRIRELIEEDSKTMRRLAGEEPQKGN